MDDNKISPIDEARKLSGQILDDIEINTVPIYSILMKTKRLARLLRDSDANKWLDYEITGYPEKEIESLESCAKYCYGSFTVTKADKPFARFSLPALETFIQLTTAENISKILPNRENNADLSIILHTEAITHISKVKSAIHAYVHEKNLSLAIGDIAQDIFQDARLSVDQFVSQNCSNDVKEKLLSITDRMKENNPESYSQALTSARRVLQSIADSIYPPQDEPFTDFDGNKHDLGTDNFVNRIMAYIEQNSDSDSTICAIRSNVKHLSARLDAINSKASKGVHTAVTNDEARLTIIHMYLIIAEIARIKKNTGIRT